jgi:hypothetical protein
MISLDGYTDYDSVVLNVTSDKVDINIVPTEEKSIIYSMDLSIFGFSTERVEYQVVKQISIIDDKLQIHLNVTEPNGAISTGSSAVTIKVPTELSFALVTNTRLGNVSIGHKDYPLALTDLSVSTRKGDLELINIGSSGDYKSLQLNTLNLTTEKGDFDLSSIDSLTVKNNIKLVAEDGEFVFKNVFASIDITGTGIRIDADSITCGINGFSFIAENGYFNIKNLSCVAGAENTIIAENVAINIDEISGKTGIITAYGDINIGKLYGYTIIENDNGNVSIGSAKESISVKTNMGNIKVDEYWATGKFTSNRGDIVVNSRGDFVAENFTEIYNVDGNVKVRNNINRLVLKTTGRSHVVVAFAKVKAGSVFQHKVETNSVQGSCVVYMPTLTGDVPYMFKANGIISGSIISNVYSSQDEQFFPEGIDASKKSMAKQNACFFFDGRIEFKGHTRTDDLMGFEI